MALGSACNLHAPAAPSRALAHKQHPAAFAAAQQQPALLLASAPRLAATAARPDSSAPSFAPYLLQALHYGCRRQRPRRLCGLQDLPWQQGDCRGARNWLRPRCASVHCASRLREQVSGHLAPSCTAQAPFCTKSKPGGPARLMRAWCPASASPSTYPSCPRAAPPSPQVKGAQDLVVPAPPPPLLPPLLDVLHDCLLCHLCRTPHAACHPVSKLSHPPGLPPAAAAACCPALSAAHANSLAALQHSCIAIQFFSTCAIITRFVIYSPLPLVSPSRLGSPLQRRS